MKTEEFTLWLKGWTELNGEELPTKDQWNLIIEHLNLCFIKVTSELGENMRPLTEEELTGAVEEMKKIQEKKRPKQLRSQCDHHRIIC